MMTMTMKARARERIHCHHQKQQHLKAALREIPLGRHWEAKRRWK